MRIVAGINKGRNITAPAGTDTRPTTDRVREALFSSLYSMLDGFEGTVVLDAFAGSGALGLEALSRGASRAVFYECDTAALKALQQNVRACNCKPGSADIRRKDVLADAPTREYRPFNLVLLDPPYAYPAEEIIRFIDTLLHAGSLADDALVVYEHAMTSKDEVIGAAQAAGLQVIATRKYGKTAVTIIKAEL